MSYRHHSQTGIGDIAWESRIHHQIDGIWLLGYYPPGIEWGDFDRPVDDDGVASQDGCNGSHPAFAWIDEGTTLEGLFVTFDGTSVKIFPED